MCSSQSARLQQKQNAQRHDPDDPAASEQALDLLRLMFAMPYHVPKDNALGYPRLLELAADPKLSQTEKEVRMRKYPDLSPAAVHSACVKRSAGGAGLTRSSGGVWLRADT